MEKYSAYKRVSGLFQHSLQLLLEKPHLLTIIWWVTWM